MSAARTVLTLAAVVALLPLAMRVRDSVGPVANVVAVRTADATEQAGEAPVRAFLAGVRGANPIQCEMILQSFNAWGSSEAPDHDSVALAATMVARRRIAAGAPVAVVVGAFRGGDDCESRVAARLLGRSQVPAARSALLAALEDESAPVRQRAAIGLGFSGDSTASGSLVRALGDRDARVRAAAAWALGAVH